MTRANPGAAGHTLLRKTSPEDLTLVHEYRFFDSSGNYWFSKLRYEPKTFRYGKNGKRTKKPEGADAVLYVAVNESWSGIGQRSLAARGRNSNTVHWTEGEKDADAVVTDMFSAVVVSCHQGACKATAEQAEQVVRVQPAKVVIWMDKDIEHPEVGAYDAALRHDRLIEAGFQGEIVVVRAPGASKDPGDMLARGIPMHKAIRVDLNWLVETAAAYNPNTRGRWGY